MQSTQELVELLTLEKLSENIFTGQNYVTPWKRIFGGQVLGQSLHAAYQTVPTDRFAHSLHAYFILAGDVNQPVRYEVDAIRDGRSFTTRRVVAKQKGRAIFNMSASFQVREQGFDHQNPMPNVLPPEVLLPDYQQLEPLRERAPKLFEHLTHYNQRAIAFRPVEKVFAEGNTGVAQNRHVWMRAAQAITADLPMQHQLLAYASDYNLLTTAAYPHRREVMRDALVMASLDHSLWFHREFRMDEWMLYELETPSASNARGFALGKIYNQQGQLLVSVAQEGLMRKRSR